MATRPKAGFYFNQAGEVFRTGARLPGGQGLRSAAILSAADNVEGLTILNVLRHFPTPTLRIDLPTGLAIASEARDAFNQSNLALAAVEQISLQAAIEMFPDGTSAAELNDLLTRPGQFRSRRFAMRLKSSSKPVDIYLPRAQTAFLGDRDGAEMGPGALGYPVVVISHGLGSDRKSYAYLADFLARRGFVAITVEHPGSSAEQLNAFVAGRASQIPDEEFIQRPVLISQVLNDLENRALSDDKLAGINFNNVAVIGQSFGGYTALALAGASINSTSLQQTCPPSFSVNISLLLQCQAIALPPAQTSQPFKDPRIKAVIAINPVTSVIFGSQSMAQIDVPVLLMAGSADTIAPALPEQILPFTWLSQGQGTRVTFPDGSIATPEENRYLLIMEGGTHFSTIGVTGSETFGLPVEIIGPSPDVAQYYTQVMSLAFLNIYLKGDSRYRPILSSAFTTRLSQPQMPLV
ncbi:MAG: alpha/beta hydrolase [Phormidesmis sp. RL_2_1]|nr:alpha/beta hydrolase [Phormidesmis sp. RL_2_1]